MTQSPGTAVSLPSRTGPLAAFAGRTFPDMNAAAQEGLRAAFAVIGFKGRNWRLKHRGEEELIKDDRGTPAATQNSGSTMNTRSPKRQRASKG